MWDRSKQNYWISRSGKLWKVIDHKTGKPIADYPFGHYDQELIEKICFANNIEEVMSLINGIVTDKYTDQLIELENEKRIKRQEFLRRLQN